MGADPDRLRRMRFSVDPAELWDASSSLSVAAAAAREARVAVQMLPAARAWAEESGLHARAGHAVERLEALSEAASWSLDDLAQELATAAQAYARSDEAMLR